MESDDDVPLILTWDEANSGLLNEEAERGDESKLIVRDGSAQHHRASMPPTQQYCSHGNHECTLLLLLLRGFKEIIQSAASLFGVHGYTQCSHRLV